MNNRFWILIASIASALGIASVNASDLSQSQGGLMVKIGDVIVQKNESGWTAIKILELDKWSDGSFAAHCLTYKALQKKPTIVTLKNAPVLVFHSPIDAGSFSQGWEPIGNESPTKDELVGFIEYLKLTDFPRYVRFTKQDSKEIVRKANEHYKRAFALGEQGKRVESIAEYSEAVRLFPLLYEAIDNRAFTYMELGRIREALNDFNESLRVNPNGMSAFFSKGECLMKLGELAEAEKVFQAGLSKFPEHRATFAMFLERVRVLRKKG